MKDERVDGKHTESKDEPPTKAPDNLYK
jgi:hypothetical protein